MRALPPPDRTNRQTENLRSISPRGVAGCSAIGGVGGNSMRGCFLVLWGALLCFPENGCGGGSWTRSIHTLRIAGGPAIRGGLILGFNPLRGAAAGAGVKESPRDSDGKASPPCGGGCVCSRDGCGSGNAKRSFAGRIPKRRVCEKISCYNTKVIATLLNH